jgi:hypothetical protein
MLDLKNYKEEELEFEGYLKDLYINLQLTFIKLSNKFNSIPRIKIESLNFLSSCKKYKHISYKLDNDEYIIYTFERNVYFFFTFSQILFK